LRYKFVVGNAENLLTTLRFRERFSSRLNSVDKQPPLFDAPTALDERGKLITALNDEAMIRPERDTHGWVTDIIATSAHDLLFSESYAATSDANRDYTEEDYETR